MFCSVGDGQLLLLACLAVESQLGLCLPVFGSTKVWTAAEGQFETYFSCSSIFASSVPLFYCSLQHLNVKGGCSLSV